MNKEWYDIWKIFRDKNVITPEQYFDTESDFIRRVQSAAFPIGNRKISQSFKNVGELGRIAKGEETPHHYMRYGSKEETALNQLFVQAEAGYLEERGLEPLEHIATSFFPSGMSAISNTLFTIASLIIPDEKKEKKFIQAESDEIYSDTNSVLHEIMHILGFSAPLKINLRKNQGNDLLDILPYHKGKIAGIYYEPISSSNLLYTDTRRLREIANYFNIPLIVDNTSLTPYLQQQMRLGADIVIHSLTKYISGKADFTAGAVIGPKQFIEWMRKLQMVTGNTIQSPMIIQQLYEQMLELPARMKSHCENATQIADYLRNSAYIESVNYPNLNSLTRFGSAGGIISFTIAGDDSKIKTRRETLFMQYILKNGRDSYQYKVSFGEDPYLFFGETTHGAPTKQNPGLIRLAVGRTPKADEAISFIDNALKYACK
ncbi:PLP-dependent transferase [Candidatus Woesearchaeota archaeon]|nr:PLP-dependent transferase [Candidatus Woesearchaeota archaeon]